MPYSNLHSLTSSLFGFTLAFNVAEVWVIAQAALVSTVGALAVAFELWSEPLLVPPAFVAEILKWYVVFAGEARDRRGHRHRALPGSRRRRARRA